MIVDVECDGHGYWVAQCEKPYLYLVEPTVDAIIKSVDDEIVELTGRTDSRYMFCWHFRAKDVRP